MSSTTGNENGVGYSKQVTYNTIGNVVSLFCQWLIIMIIPRISDFGDAGVFAVAISVCSILNLFATFSINQYQISDQYVRFSENGYKVCRLVTVAISFILIVPISLLFGYTAEQNLVILLYMVYRNFLHIAYLYTASLQISGRLDYVGIVTGIEGAVSFVVFLASYMATGNLVLSTMAMAVIGGGSFLLMTLHGYRRFVPTRTRLKADASELRPLLLLGVPLLLSTVASVTITALPKLVLQADWGDEIVGIFSTLSSPTIIVPTLAISMFAPFIIYFSNIAREGDMRRIRIQYTKAMIILGGFGIVCLIVCRLLAPWFFGTIYGDSILEYMDCFYVLVIGIILYTAGTLGTTVLITKEQGRAAAIASLIALAIGAAVFLAVIPSHGMMGASLSLMSVYGLFGLLISVCVYLIPLKKSLYPQDAE